MWGGGRPGASLASSFQAQDLESLRPSSGQLNQWPLCVSYLETILICTTGELLASIKRDSWWSNIPAVILHLAKGTLRNSDCGWCVCSFCAFAACLYACWPPAASDVIFQGCVGQINCPLWPEMCVCSLYRTRQWGLAIQKRPSKLQIIISRYV